MLGQCLATVCELATTRSAECNFVTCCVFADSKSADGTNCHWKCSVIYGIPYKANCMDRTILIVLCNVVIFTGHLIQMEITMEKGS